MDWIPILSQAKSVFQWICDDVEGAKQTQTNFLKTCPIVSQGTSIVQSISGDIEAALETQMAFGRTMSGVANGIPVVGHAKGFIHYACGDSEGGDQSMKSSSRTIGYLKTLQLLQFKVFKLNLLFKELWGEVLEVSLLEDHLVQLQEE